MTSSWNNEKVLAFIKEYEKREVLWRKDNKVYHNITKKEDAWREISEIIHENIDALKKKMESLRGSRRREKTRIRSAGRRKETYEPTWFAWESLKFLDDLDEFPATVHDYTASENEESDLDNLSLVQNLEDVGIITSGKEENLQQSSIIEEKKNSAKNVIPNRKQIAKRKFLSSKKLPPRKGRIEDSRAEETFKILKNQVAAGKKDECALFADFIAEKMRKLDDKTSAILQYEILNLIFQTEMAYLQDDDSQ